MDVKADIRGVTRTFNHPALEHSLDAALSEPLLFADALEIIVDECFGAGDEHGRHHLKTGRSHVGDGRHAQPGLLSANEAGVRASATTQERGASTWRAFAFICRHSGE